MAYYCNTCGNTHETEEVCDTPVNYGVRNKIEEILLQEKYRDAVTNELIDELYELFITQELK